MMSRDRVAVLYISYDGVLEPLGESQVVGYLERLAANYDITLLSFEKPADISEPTRLARMARRLQACGIGWIRLRYHKWPPLLSTAFDALTGIDQARRACRRGAVRIIHARSYVPALMALGARGSTGARFLFDMRGFWVDEKVEAGHWKRGSLVYTAAKWWERRFFKTADAVVSLTAAGVLALPEVGCVVSRGVPIEVIPTCVDLQRFRPIAKNPELVAQLGLAGSPVIGCVGTMSNWYMRHEMLQYLAHIARSIACARILIVTREDHQQLRQEAEAAGVPAASLVFADAHFDAMPQFTSLFDAGVFFIRPSLSKRGSAATKLAEFLACGVPVIINDGVGDSGTIVGENRVGVVLSTLNDREFARSLPAVRALLADPQVRDRCRKVAADLFDIETGTDRYRRLYQRLQIVDHTPAIEESAGL